MAGDYIKLRTLRSTVPMGHPEGEVPMPQLAGGVRIFSEAMIATICPQEACAAAEAHHVDEVEPKAEFDRRLHATCISGNDPGAFLCLRCRCSHAALNWLKAIFARYVARGYPLEPMEMAPCLLNDDGRIEAFSQFGRNELSKNKVKYESFLMDVVRSFDPRKGAGLNTWTQRKADSNRCLARYFRTVGLLMKSSWSILAHDAGPTNMREAWRLYGTLGLKEERVLALLASYQHVYIADEKKQRGWQPSKDFLHAVAPDQEAQQTEDHLLAMAQAFRARQAPWEKHRHHQQEQAWDEASPEIAETATSTDGLSESFEEDQELLQLIDLALTRAVIKHMPALLASVETMDEQRRCMWLAYAQGLNNREIASHCQCSAGTASKKVTGPLNRLLPTMAREALNELKRNGRSAPLVGHDLAATERAVQALQTRLVEASSAPDPPHGQAPRSLLGLWITERLSRQ
jgi:hypothetical protein